MRLDEAPVPRVPTHALHLMETSVLCAIAAGKPVSEGAESPSTGAAACAKEFTGVFRALVPVCFSL